MTRFQHGKLLAQCQILEQEVLKRAKETKDGSQGDPEESKHGEDLCQNVGGEDRSDVIEVIDSKDGWSFGQGQKRQGRALILSSQWPEKVGKWLMFISLNVEPETHEAAVAALDALRIELEARGAPVKDGRVGLPAPGGR